MPLPEYFLKSNILINPVEYLNFAVPYKLFESLGYGCPLLGTNHTMTGDFIFDV